MTRAAHIPLLLGLLGCFVVKTLSRNSSTAIINKKFCSQIVDVPAQVLQRVSSLQGSDEPTRSAPSIFTTFRERERPQRRLGYREEPIACNSTNSHVQGKMRESGKTIMVEVRACQSVKNLVIQLRSLGFIRKRHNRRLITCSRLHDTLVLSEPGHREIISINPVISRKSGEIVSIAWNYELEDDTGSTTWFYPNNSLTLTTGDQNSEATKAFPDVQENDCRFSSVRFGSPQCKHMECDYLLTYTFVNHTMLVMEISGKSDGWVALILSSDQQVGGDEIVACKRRSPGEDLEAMSAWISLPHSRPQRKSGKNLVLVEQDDKNGYIYCKMVLTRKLNDVGGDTSLDMTANWYQMYAKGKIDRGGAMLHHSEIPPTTSKKVSMLVPFQVSSKSFEIKQVEVSEQIRQIKCADDALGDRLAAPKLGSANLPMMCIVILLVFRFEI